MMAAKMVDEERITVFNSKTICGSRSTWLRRRQGSPSSAREWTRYCRPWGLLSDMQSFLIAVDFSYIRSGRALRTAALLGSILKIKPVLRLNDEGPGSRSTAWRGP